MDGTGLVDLPEAADASVDRPAVRQGLALRLSSRIGAWGLLGGILAPILPQLGVPLPLGFSSVIGGIGTLAGGLGIAVASSLVLKETFGTRRTLMYGALAGIPFGLATAFYGAIRLWFWPAVQEHFILFGLISLSMFGFGVLLVVLFLAGLVKAFWNTPDSELEVP